MNFLFSSVKSNHLYIHHRQCSRNTHVHRGTSSPIAFQKSKVPARHSCVPTFSGNLNFQNGNAPHLPIALLRHEQSSCRSGSHNASSHFPSKASSKAVQSSCSVFQVSHQTQNQSFRPNEVFPDRHTSARYRRLLAIWINAEILFKVLKRKCGLS